MPIVYQTRNKLNGKIYVGVTNDKRSGYLGSGKVLLHAIKKYGKENFERSTLFDCDSHEDAYFLEQIIVNKWFIQQEWNYNINGGGYGASVLHPETKKKLSKARKKLYNNPEFVERITKATTEGIRRSIKNGTFGGHEKGPNNPNYGIKRTKEFVENLRRVKMKPVLLLEDGEIIKRFESVEATVEYFRLHRSTIENYINGKTKYPQHLKSNQKLILECKKED